MISRSLVRFAVVLCCASAPCSAFAEEPLRSDAKTEARERFDRAVRLFEEKNNDAALAEFKRVYEIAPNPVVLLNIGLVNAAMGRPVDAVDALDRVLASPGTLSDARLARARAVRSEQASRVGQLLVTINVDGAAIDVDTVQIAKAPLSGPIRVASGIHVVGAVAKGHAPARKEVSLAGGATEKVSLELTPIAGGLAHVTVKSHVPAATVRIDGTAVGRTPLSASISVLPGPHKVELARPGYVTAQQDMVLGEGATGDIALEPELDAHAPPSQVSTLTLAISQPQALVTVDGQTQGAYSGSLRVAAGVHRLRVEQGGYLPYEREIDLPGGTSTTVPVDLFPTAETLAAYTGAIRTRRTWGWIGVASGALVAGGAVGYLAYNAGPRGRAVDEYNGLLAAEKAGTHPCNISGTGQAADRPDVCNALISSARDNAAKLQLRDDISYVVGGVGLAVLGIGVVLIVTSNDPHRYDRKPGGELFSFLSAPTFWQSRGGGGVSWGGAF